MVYRGLDIGTAKPVRGDPRAVPHHLIDILEPTESYSAGRFARTPRALIAEIRARGRLPLLVGGTLLYSARSARRPLGVAARRSSRACRARSRSGRAWLARAARALAARRPGCRGADRAERPAAHPARARGACADWPADQRAAASAADDRERPGVSSCIALVPENRAELAVRIEQRFDAMVAAGFVAEVERLRARGDLHSDLPAMRAVGYRQLWAYLDGRCTVGKRLARRRSSRRASTPNGSSRGCAATRTSRAWPALSAGTRRTVASSGCPKKASSRKTAAGLC